MIQSYDDKGVILLIAFENGGKGFYSQTNEH